MLSKEQLVYLEGLDGDISKKTQRVLIRILLDIDGEDVSILFNQQEQVFIVIDNDTNVKEDYEDLFDKLGIIDKDKIMIKDITLVKQEDIDNELIKEYIDVYDKKRKLLKRDMYFQYISECMYSISVLCNFINNIYTDEDVFLKGKDVISKYIEHIV